MISDLPKLFGLNLDFVSDNGYAPYRFLRCCDRSATEETTEFEIGRGGNKNFLRATATIVV